MEFIIDFFIGIDGWVYYTILVVNTILIFAIIGYLGEKNNEQLLKASMVVSNSNIKSGTTNLTPTHVSSEINNNLPATAASSTSINQDATVQNGQPTNYQQVNTVPNNVQVSPTNSAPSVINGVQNPNPSSNVNTTTSGEQAPSVLVINSSNVNKDVK